MSRERSIEPPAADADGLAQEAERPLSPVEFEAYVAAPLTPDEWQNESDLIRWFRTRYPTPEDRLRYARQTARRLVRPRPARVIDKESYRNAAPDPASLLFTPLAGPLAGARITVARSGSFRIEADGLLPEPLFERNVALELPCGQGLLRIEDASQRSRSLTVSGTSFGAVIEGEALTVTLRGKQAPRKPVWRCHIDVDPTIGKRILFPGWLEDVEGRGRILGRLPLAAGDFNLELLLIDPAGPVVIESTEQALDLNRFARHTIRLRVLLSYLTGYDFRGDFAYVLVDAEDGSVAEIQWKRGSTMGHHFTPPIPCDWSSFRRAREALGLDANARPMEPAIISRCLQQFLAQPDLAKPITYLLSALHAPIEIAGALTAIALECLVSSPAGERLPEHHGVPLSEDERAAISTDLHDYIHRGGILDSVDRPSSEWNACVRSHRLLYTAVNKLLLRRLGYLGPVNDWGSTPADSLDPSFTLICPI